MYVHKGDKMKRNINKRQMRKVSLKFWNNMILFSILVMFIIGSLSAVTAAEPSYSYQGASTNSMPNDIRPTLTSSDAIKAFNAVSLRDPNARITNVYQNSLTANDYEVESSYTITTNSGTIAVSLTSYYASNTGTVNTLSKRLSVNGAQEVVEKENELYVVHNGKLTTVSVTDKENAQKMLVNAVELLVEKETIEKPTLSANKEFIVMVDNNADISYGEEILSTGSYNFYKVQSSSWSDLAKNRFVVKICEASRDRLRKFVDHSKEVLVAEAEELIRELKLKKTNADCIDLPQLRQYMEEEGWDVQPGQSSPYQLFVTPDNSVVQDVSKGKTVSSLYNLAVTWPWVSDQTLNGRNEKWLKPEHFLRDTPGFSTNPSAGDAVSDCSEQANTLVSMLRASGVSAEDVRVALGNVDFDGTIGGHAWVEIKENGQWMVLDSTCGPYYDDDDNELVTRSGVGYTYWQYRPYPIEDVWCYYNDVYYSDENGEGPEGWSTDYSAEENFLAGFSYLAEESLDSIFVAAIIAAAAVIVVVIVVRIREDSSGKK